MYYIGIDLGGTFIKAGLVDENGKIILKDSIPTGKERPYQEIVRDMAMLVKKIIKDAQIDEKDVKSIGIGSPGTPDDKEGILVYANNLPDFVNVPLRTEIQKYIDLPVILDNDANCAALAESIAGAAKDVKNSVTITLGTGVGSGVVIDGKLYSGFNYSAPEMGHMVIRIDGEQCTCGRKGCWEAYASASGLIEQTKRAAMENKDSLINLLVDGDLSKIDAKTAFDAAKQGDETGRKVVEQYIKYLAEGLTNVINIFAPEVVAIGGGVSKEGEYLLKPLRELVYKDVYFKGEPQTQIRVAQMGNDAGIIGAAMLGKINA
ncbi:MAG TPA: ROK family protein [Clostridiaceae bacterium]|nr:ROK family protein [Clostridiaceae bacterium]